MAEESARGEDAARGVSEAGGMALFGTIGSGGYLRPDGSVWIYDTDDWTAEALVWRWRRATSREALGAIKVAAERIPELAALLPGRPQDTPPCSACHGSGHCIRLFFTRPARAKETPAVAPGKRESTFL